MGSGLKGRSLKYIYMEHKFDFFVYVQFYPFWKETRSFSTKRTWILPQRCAQLFGFFKNNVKKVIKYIPNQLIIFDNPHKELKCQFKLGKWFYKNKPNKVFLKMSYIKVFLPLLLFQISLLQTSMIMALSSPLCFLSF